MITKLNFTTDWNLIVRYFSKGSKRMVIYIMSAISYFLIFSFRLLFLLFFSSLISSPISSFFSCFIYLHWYDVSNFANFCNISNISTISFKIHINKKIRKWRICDPMCTHKLNNKFQIKCKKNWKFVVRISNTLYRKKDNIYYNK